MDCAEFLARMEPMARWAARRQAARHPLLAQEDLLQDAMEALVRVWRSYFPRSPDDLCCIGRVAVLRRIRKVRAHAWCRGEGGVAGWVDLDAPMGPPDDSGAALTVSDLLGAEGIEDCYFWFALDELERSLDDTARLVLGELLDPGVKTLKAIRWAWRQRLGQGGNWWLKCRREVIARGLGLRQRETAGALCRLRACAGKIFLREMSVVGYREIGGGVDRQERSGEMMLHESESRGFVPSGDDLPPEPAKSGGAAGVASGATTETKTAKTKTAKTKTAKTKTAKTKTAKTKTAKTKTAAKPKAAKTKTAAKPKAAAKNEKVVLGKPARPGSMRAVIQECCGTRPVTVADLVARAAKVPDVPLKVRIMLSRGLLQRA